MNINNDIPSKNRNQNLNISSNLKMYDVPSHLKMETFGNNTNKNNNNFSLNNQNHRMVNPLIQNISLNRSNNKSTRKPVNINITKKENFLHNDNALFTDNEDDMINEFEDDSIFGDSSNFYANNNWESNSSLESLNLILEKQRKQQLNNPFHQTHIFLPIKIKIEYDPITKKTMLNHYEIIKEMGNGRFGKVKLVKNMYTDELMAMKIVNRHSTTNSKRLLSKFGNKDEPDYEDKADDSEQTTLQDINNKNTGFSDDYFNTAFHHGIEDSKIRREITIMKKLNNKNIVKLIEVLNDPESKKIYMILEYCAHGEIKWCPGDQLEINAKGPPLLSFSKARDYFRQVVLGLEYLQNNNILHRDLKPANLLLTGQDVVKISDFGCSLIVNNCSEDDLIKTVGTPVFYAPEICVTNACNFYKTNSIRQVISFPLDIWALGVTLFCFLFGKLPFNSKHEMKLFDIICNGRLEFPLNVADIEIRDYHNSQNLLLKLFNKNPFKRITIEEIKVHPFTIGDLTEEQQFAFLNSQFENVDADDYGDMIDEFSLGYQDNNKHLHGANSSKHHFHNANSSRYVSLPVNSSFASLDSFYIDNHAHLASNNKVAQDFGISKNSGININNGNSFNPIDHNNTHRKLSMTSSKDMQFSKIFGNRFNKRTQTKPMDFSTENPQYSLPRSHYLPQNSSLDSSNKNGISRDKPWKYYSNVNGEKEGDDGEDDDDDEQESEFGYDYKFNRSTNIDNSFSDTESLPFEFKEDSDSEDAFEHTNTKLNNMNSRENSNGPIDGEVYLVDALNTNGNNKLNNQFNIIQEQNPRLSHNFGRQTHGNYIFNDSSDDLDENEVDEIEASKNLYHNNSYTNMAKAQFQDQNQNNLSVADLQGIEQVDIPENLLLQMNHGGLNMTKNFSEIEIHPHAISARRTHSTSEIHQPIANNSKQMAAFGLGEMVNQNVNQRLDSSMQHHQPSMLKSTTQLTNTVANSEIHSHLLVNDDNVIKEKFNEQKKSNFKTADLLQSFINK